MMKALLFGLLPLGALAQNSPTLPSAPAWGGGLAVGNALEAHVGAQRQSWIALGRVRYNWWGPTSGPGSSLFDDVNTRSRQLEVASLVGYSRPLGRGLCYGAVGISYLRGRQLGEYSYSVNNGGLLSKPGYFFSYRRYQALGLPLEIGALTPPNRRGTRASVALQANFNPEKPVYCLLIGFWIGGFGKSTR